MFLSLVKLTTFRRTQIYLKSQNKNEETEALVGCIACIHRTSNCREMIKTHAQNYVVLLIAHLVLITTTESPPNYVGPALT